MRAETIKVADERVAFIGLSEERNLKVAGPVPADPWVPTGMGICQGSLPKSIKPLKRELQEKLQSPIIIFMVGGPGCGKQIQGHRLASKYDFYHVGIGELLRAEASRPTRKGKTIRDIILKGALVPSGYILELLTDNMLKAENVKGFFVEGFPREIHQAKLFEEVVGRAPNIVIVLDCSTETMVQRLLIRSQMGERVDDHDKIIQNRLDTYYTLCEPVFTHYLQKSLLRHVGLKRTWLGPLPCPFPQNPGLEVLATLQEGSLFASDVDKQPMQSFQKDSLLLVNRAI
uniref:adenylate kinase isoenzyme 1-like isoform X2 n=1 Tax=Podarcis muralis TaxID=64176 RepID=UPI00109F4EEF|nr:adenylate kinase isoenzyme 1-like isoform X2 [Podarcis muralis]